MANLNFPLLTMTIDGRAAEAAAVVEVVNPSTGTVFAYSPDGSPAEIDAAVDAANRAFAAWSGLPLDERRRLLLAFGDRVKAHSEELAILLTQEQGKPLAKSRSEIAAALNYLEAYAKLDLPMETLRDTPTQRVELHRRPLGAVGAITAWNYPILLAIWKIAPGLLTGNTMVLKPSPLTPLATLRLGELSRTVLPPGVLNVVAGAGAAGERLVCHPRIRKIAFTGSVPTGKRIMANAAGNLKRLTLELGGNDAGIVLPDADPQRIAADLFWAKFSNCGQVCAALKRLYIHEDIHDAVGEALVGIARKVRVGDGFDPASEIGPIQNRTQRDKVQAMLDDALACGAKRLFQGEAPSGNGFFFPVTLLVEASEGMRVVDDEVFGPLLPIMRYRDLDDAIARANATEYGLGASVWGSDFDRAANVARRLEAGSVWVNQHPSMGPDIPFGGIKESGIGVECAQWGMEEYTAIQITNVKRNAA